MKINSSEYSYIAELSLGVKNKHEKYRIISPRKDISIEEFTNVFVEEGYLDEYNAKLMIIIFTKGKGTRDKEITMKDDLLLLITFIYLVDKFDSLRIPLTDKKREHKSFSNSNIMGLNEHCEYIPLIRNNFKFISRKKMFDDSIIWRNWKFVDNAFNECVKLYADTNNSKKTTGEDFCFTALSFYADNPTPFVDRKYNDKEKAKISVDMLKIFCRLSSKK